MRVLTSALSLTVVLSLGSSALAEEAAALATVAARADSLLTSEASLAAREDRPISADVWQEASKLMATAIGKDPQGALQALKQMPDWGACVALSQLLESDVKAVVTGALGAVRLRGTPEWMPFLVDPLAGAGQEGRDVLATAWLAGHLDDESGRRALMHFVSHGNEPRPHEVLLAMLDDTEAGSTVRVLALRGLRSSTDLGTALVVLRASVSEDRQVAGQATRVLRSMLSRAPEICAQIASCESMKDAAVVAHVAPLLTHPGWTGRVEWLQQRFEAVTDSAEAMGLLELARALPEETRGLALARAALGVAGDDPAMLRVALATYPDVMTIVIEMDDRVSALYQLLDGWEAQDADDPLVAHAFRMASWKLLGQTGVRTPAELATHIKRLPTVADEAGSDD